MQINFAKELTDDLKLRAARGHVLVVDAENNTVLRKGIWEDIGEREVQNDDWKGGGFTI